MGQHWGPSRRSARGAAHYFIFIILSTLRLDFWLSTFTGFVASVELFGMAMFYHPALAPDPEPDIYYHRRAQRHRPDLRRVGRRGRQSTAPGICRQHPRGTARDRITNLFGQHVSPAGGRAASGRGNDDRQRSFAGSR